MFCIEFIILVNISIKAKSTQTAKQVYPVIEDYEPNNNPERATKKTQSHV